MSCVMKVTPDQNESINSIFQHGHVIRKDYFVLTTAS